MTDGAPLPAPPRRAEPATLITEYLPRLWAALSAEAKFPPWELEAQLEVIGEGAWSARLRGGALEGREGRAEARLFGVRADPESYRLGAHDVLPRAIRRVGPRADEIRAHVRRFATERAASFPLDQIASLPGTVEVVYTDDAGDQAHFEIAVGSGTGPRARVAITEADLWTLVDGEARLARLLGRVRVEGDVGWLLRVARLLDDA